MFDCSLIQFYVAFSYVNTKLFEYEDRTKIKVLVKFNWKNGYYLKLSRIFMDVIHKRIMRKYFNRFCEDFVLNKYNTCNKIPLTLFFFKSSL